VLFRSDRGDPVPESISIEPADLEVTVVDGVVINQDYKVTLVYSDGNKVDATQSAKLELRDPQYGMFSRANLAINGGGAGPTRVIATVEDVTGDTGLTVYVRKTIIDPTLPPTTPDMFDTAVEDPTLAPTIRYPLDKILVPPNIGQFDVHWNAAAGTNVFQLRMFNTYVDIRRYTTGLTPPGNEQFWTKFEPAEWYPIASTKQQLALQLAAMNTATPTKKGTAAKQAVDVTNENTRGGIYYWATTNPATILRYDVEKPDVPPSKLFEAGTEPGGAGTCHGCHTLSKDGTRLALTLDGGNGRGTAIKVATRQLTVPVSTDTRWNFATFTPDANKLVTVYGGVMSIRNSDTGEVLGTLGNTTGKYATHPEISPDGSQLVNAECVGGYEAFANNCELVVRPFDAAANSAGAIKPLLAANVDGLNSFYPSFSPDGKWLVFTRAAAAVSSYNATSAETWVMKADGTAPPIKLAAADLGQGGRTNSWARWVPFGQTFGPANEPMFYLTFSSMRPYGVRLPAGGRPQIWMTPFFPARAEAGQDPTGPAFRVPFQDVATGNHIAQWTQAVVVIE
jgi:hypothetical protein